MDNQNCSVQLQQQPAGKSGKTISDDMNGSDEKITNGVKSKYPGLVHELVEHETIWFIHHFFKNSKRCNKRVEEFQYIFNRKWNKKSGLS